MLNQNILILKLCSTEDEFQRNCAAMKQKLLERKYNENDLNKQME